MKDLRKEKAQMMNQALRTFPNMMTSMMEMMAREREEDRKFKKLLMKQMAKGNNDSD